MDLAKRYPLLHTPDRWDWASITMTFTSEIPPDALVASTHVVAFIGEGVLLCRAAEGVWFFPGGTREPGEAIESSVHRELLEEAGARILGRFHPIGAHVGVSDALDSYRPHLPHPRKAWLWGWADVEVIGAPSNPEDGEQIVEVRSFPVDEAARHALSDNSWGGELIRLAAERRRDFLSGHVT